MGKSTHNNGYITASGLTLFAALACAVAAVCLWRFVSQPIFWYVASGCATAFFLAYVIVCAVASKRCEHGASYFVLAWETVGVSVILIALLPLAAVMWVAESIAESCKK